MTRVDPNAGDGTEPDDDSDDVIEESRTSSSSSDPTIAAYARQQERRRHQQSARDNIVTALACASAGVLAPIMINANWVTGSPYPPESALEDRANDEIVIRNADKEINPYWLHDRQQATNLIGKNPNLNNQDFIGAAERIIQDNQSESWGSKNAGLVALAAGLAGLGGTLWFSYKAYGHHCSARQDEGNTM